MSVLGGWDGEKLNLPLVSSSEFKSVECWDRQWGKTSFSFLMFPLIAVLIYIIIVFVFNAGVYSCFISRRWNSRYVLNFLLPSTFNCSSVQVEGHVYKLMDSIAQSLIKSYQVNERWIRRFSSAIKSIGWLIGWTGRHKGELWVSDHETWTL